MTILEELMTYRGVAEAYSKEYSRWMDDLEKLEADESAQEQEEFDRAEERKKKKTLKKEIKEYYYTPSEKQESPEFNRGKQSVMDELTKCVEKIPDTAKISYETFAKFLIQQRHDVGKRTATKAFEYYSGWNFILRLVSEICPKTELTKDELASVIGFVGEKELKWN